MTRADAAETGLPDTDLIPKVLGRAQSSAGDWEVEGEAIRARQQFGALLRHAEATLASLRKVAEMPCISPGSQGRFGFWADCRQREREAMGGKVPPEEQRQSWCPRCVAADALEHLPE